MLRLYEEQQERQERALHRVKGPPQAPGGQAAVGAGKVRTLLQYRRDHGRDKSYPLDPLPPSPPKPTRKPARQPPRHSRQQPVLYFGGSQQDLHFSDERDYGQSFQVGLLNKSTSLCIDEFYFKLIFCKRPQDQMNCAFYNFLIHTIRDTI